MNLILGGGGDAADSKAVHQLFLDKVEVEKKVLYIPVAWKDENFDSCRAWFEATFSALGSTKFEMWTDLSDKSMEDLCSFGGIYIGGGNTFKLLNTLRTTKFDHLLLQFTKSNRPVFGGSAGAIIFGKTIDTAAFCSVPDENEVGLRNTDGFNLINSSAIQCHYLTSQDEVMAAFVKNSKISVIALGERSGLFVTDQDMKIVGFEPGYLFTEQGKTEYMIGSKLK
jgi:dipeptidase E